MGKSVFCDGTYRQTDKQMDSSLNRPKGQVSENDSKKIFIFIMRCESKLNYLSVLGI